MAWTKLVSTALDDDQRLDMAVPMPMFGRGDDFPPDMKIGMDEWLLDRLGLDDNVEVGGYYDIRCFAVATSVSKTQVNGQTKCHICFTIEKISVESEDDESTEPDDEED